LQADGRITQGFELEKAIGNGKLGRGFSMKFITKLKRCSIFGDKKSSEVLSEISIGGTLVNASFIIRPKYTKFCTAGSEDNAAVF
jgi:hypothetical protein